MVTAQSKAKIFPMNNSLSQPVRQIALIVVLTLIGYSLAPPDLTTGAYVAQIHTTIAGQTISLDFPFAIGAATGAQVDDDEAAIILWDVESGAPQASFASDGTTLTSVAWSPDETGLIAGTLAGEVLAWELP